MAGNNNNNRAPEMIGTYKECRRNHALSVGGHAVDGCREFTPGGPEGTEQALLCQACGCHRSFHRHELLINIRNLPLPAAPAAARPPLPPHGVPLPPPPAHPVHAAHMVPFVPVMVLHRAVNPQIPPRPPLPPQPENADGEIDFEHRPSVQVNKMSRHPF